VTTADSTVVRLLGDLQEQLAQITACADVLTTVVPRGPADRQIGELRACASRAAELASELEMTRPLEGRRARDLNEAIRVVVPTLSAMAGVQFDLRLSPLPVPVAALRGELERILVNLVLNTCDSVSSANVLTLVTDLVTNPSTGCVDLPRGRYARLIVTNTPGGAIPSGVGTTSAAWAVGQVQGRVSVDSDATGTTLSMLLPLIAAL
jgi:signal transduction histidine kinase